MGAIVIVRAVLAIVGTEALQQRLQEELKGRGSGQMSALGQAGQLLSRPAGCYLQPTL